MGIPRRFRIQFLIFLLCFCFSSLSNMYPLEARQEGELENSFIFGLKLFQDGLYLPAREAFLDFLKKNGSGRNAVIARFLLAESFRNTKQYDLAKKNFQLLLAGTTNRSEKIYLKSYIRLGEILELEGRVIKAAANYESAFANLIRMKSKKESYLSRLITKKFFWASIARYEKKDCKKSIENLVQLEKISDWKDSVQEESYAYYLFVRGDCALRANNFKLSRNYFSKILSLKTSASFRDQSKFYLAVSFDKSRETERSLVLYLQIVNQKKITNLDVFLLSLWRLSEISEEGLKWNNSLRYLKLFRKTIEIRKLVEDEKFSEFYGLSEVRIKGIKNFLEQVKQRNLEIKTHDNVYKRKVIDRKKKIEKIDKKYLEEVKKRGEKVQKRKQAYRKALINYKKKVRKLEEEYLEKVKERKKKVRALKVENTKKLDSYKKKIRRLEEEYLEKVKERKKKVRALKVENTKKLDSYKKKIRKLEEEYLEKVK
ncbi:MAG: hypothetical protein VX794_06090, partial [Nitrospinota bacterium]|nr:hypothetical protein [Nitrospinota bacterium]